jgi:asparagine synthase (glutamine-hydrolysing)
VVSHDRVATRQDPRVHLAFRRLAVIDLDPRSNQPMHTTPSRFTLVFNGEIYNYRELREKFTAQDARYRWKTQGDAEVILRGYELWGDGVFGMIDGMFALALWDEQHKGLTLARDRYGQKPLYVARSPGRVAFASERQALTVLDPSSATISDEDLVHYFRYGYVQPVTGVRQIEPGRVVCFLGSRESSPEFATTQPASAEVSPASTKGVIERAVARQMVADVPLGVFLSGGVDSSIVALCASKVRKIETFSIGFDDERYDESAYAREVARHLGTTHREFRAKPDLARDLPLLARSFGEPFADSSMLPTYLLCRETRKHVTVALSGDGGDELFGGYDRYRALLHSQKWAGLIPRVVSGPLGGVLGRGHPKSKWTRAGRFLASLSLPVAKRYDSYVRVFSDKDIAAVLPGLTMQTPPLAERFAAFEKSVDGQDVVRIACDVDGQTYLPHDLHTKVDRASMLHALEVRAPLMDLEVLLYSAHLTSPQLNRKVQLREAFAAELPTSVFARPKRGFAAPIGEWFCGELRAMLHDAVDAAGSFTRERLSRDAVGRMMDEHQSHRRDHSQRLFAVLMLELWHAGVRENGSVSRIVGR